jgi:hypothetical protein
MPVTAQQDGNWTKRSIPSITTKLHCHWSASISLWIVNCVTRHLYFRKQRPAVQTVIPICIIRRSDRIVQDVTRPIRGLLKISQRSTREAGFHCLGHIIQPNALPVIHRLPSFALNRMGWIALTATGRIIITQPTPTISKPGTQRIALSVMQ